MELKDLKQKYIIAVSGGPDSMALLDMCQKAKLNFVVCTIDYQKRKDSYKDVECVKTYCQKYNIILELAYPKYQGHNFQAWAREVRYDFFVEMAKKYECQGIIVAHHLDDELETIMMQKNRPSNYNYYGLKEIGEYRNVMVIRPLLRYKKQELEKYCQVHDINYRIDYTNLESHYTRNYYRNKILVNMSDEEKTELLEYAKKQNEILEKSNQELEGFNNYHEIELAKFLKLTHISQKRYLYQFIKYHLKNSNKLTNKTNENIINWLKNGKNGSWDLYDDNILVKEYDKAYIKKKSKKIDYEYQINKDEYIETPFFKVKNKGNFKDGILLFEHDYPLTIRNYRAGDKIEIKTGTKKVSRVFIDKKIPQEQRKLWPIVLNSKNKVIFIVSLLKDKNYSNDTANLFVVK